MQAQNIRAIARNPDLKPGNLGKVRVIRAIQLFQGNFDCIGTAYEGGRGQHACAWRKYRVAPAEGGIRDAI